MNDPTLPDRLLALRARLDAKLGAGFIDDVTGDEMSALTEAAAALSGREAVAKLVNRIERGGKTTTFIRPTSLGMDMPLGEYPLYLGPTTPPPGDGWVLHGRVNGYLPRQQAIEIHADAPLPDWLTSVRDLRVTVVAAPSAKGVAE